jgi:hypothetical protein
VTQIRPIRQLSDRHSSQLNLDHARELFRNLKNQMKRPRGSEALILSRNREGAGCQFQARHTTLETQ